MRYYAGIGSRKTPPEMLEEMSLTAYDLARDGFTLRSGGADGADSAFESGADAGGGPKQIFLPWPNFNGRQSGFDQPTQEAMEMAAEHHPAWKFLSYGAKKLHARNCHQVLGPDLATPVEFVVCWTPGGKGGGGTGQAIRIAKAHDIPVHELFQAP